MKKVFFQIFADFDSTITPFDLCTKIPLLKSNRPEQQDWITVSKLYYENYQQNLQKVFSCASLPIATSMSEQICTFLKPLDDSEQYGVSLLQQYKILHGLQKSSLQQFSIENMKQSTELADIKKVFSNSMLLDQTISVMTTNWSQDVVTTALDFLMQTDATEKKETKTHFELFGNQMLFDNQNICIGYEPNCVTSKSKLDFFKQHSKKYAVENCITVYIGDSHTDLPTLLHADVGLLFNPGQTTRKLCSHFGINLVPVDQYTPNIPSVLYNVSHWNQISMLLDKIQQLQSS